MLRAKWEQEQKKLNDAKKQGQQRNNKKGAGWKEKFTVDQVSGYDGHDRNQPQNRKKSGPSLWDQIWREISYHPKVAWRFYMTLIKEGLLAAILAFPVWFLFNQIMGLQVVTIRTDFWVLWCVFLVLFILQNFMFHK